MKRIFLVIYLMFSLFNLKAQSKDSITIIFNGAKFPKGIYGVWYNNEIIFLEKLKGNKLFVFKVSRDSLLPLGGYFPITIIKKTGLTKRTLLSDIHYNSCSNYLKIFVNYRIKRKYLLMYEWSNVIPEIALGIKPYKFKELYYKWW